MNELARSKFAPDSSSPEVLQLCPLSIRHDPHDMRSPLQYSHAIYFCSCVGAELGGAADIGQLVEFVESGGNLLVAVDSSASESMRELASDLGVDLEPSGNSVVDHFDFWPGDVSHHTVLARNFLSSKALWGSRSPQVPFVLALTRHSLCFKWEQLRCLAANSASYLLAALAISCGQPG